MDETLDESPESLRCPPGMILATPDHPLFSKTPSPAGAPAPSTPEYSYTGYPSESQGEFAWRNSSWALAYGSDGPSSGFGFD